MSKKLTDCKACGAEIAKSAKTCPHCGAKNKKPIFKKWWFWAIVVLVLIGAMASGGNDDTPTGNDPANNDGTIVDTNPDNSKDNETTLTSGQKNALRSADKYLAVTPFSYGGLIDQLEFEKYSHEDAVYAADNCGADWNEQALKSAKAYLKTSAFSYSGLIAQLEFEQFTTEQATYGADNCGADWNEQAAKCAKNYLDLMAFSREGLIDQLIFEGFTQEQAEYGAAQNGY